MNIKKISYNNKNSKGLMMNKLKFLVLTTMLCLSMKVFSNESMRDCMLLPVTDGNDNQLGFKVYEEIEKYLKTDGWCNFRSNSNLINILGEYNKNLVDHLGNKDVLKIIAEKTKAGSMIKIKLEKNLRDTGVYVDVIGENGEDLYFKEKTLLQTTDARVIAQTVKNWLELYEKSIPYRGKIKGVLGDQFTIDIGSKARIYNGSDLIVQRMLGKRRHPLLSEVIDYNVEKIGAGRVIDVNENQAQAKMYQYDTDKKLKIGDWVIVRNQNESGQTEVIPYVEKDEAKIGTLGSVGLFLGLGSGKFEKSNPDQSGSGLMIGAEMQAEVWATRNFWGGLDIGKSFGEYSKDTGSFASANNSTQNTAVRVKFGYKYLPMGYFFGPQIDVYGGYGSYTYDIKNNSADGLTEFSFKGLLLGARANMPVYERYRALVYFDFLLTNSFSENINVIGNNNDSSTYRLGFGGQYLYAPNITYALGAETLSSKVDSNSSNKEMQFNDLSVKVGAIFSF